MATTALQVTNFSVHFVFFTIDLNYVQRPVHQYPSQRVRRLIASEQDTRGRFGDIVFQVVQNASALAHPRCTDNYTWLLGSVERLGLFNLTDVSQSFKVQRISVVFVQHGIYHCIIVALWVSAKDIRSVDRQRAVYENLDRRQFISFGQLVQSIDNFLGTPDGESRDDQFAAVVPRLLDDLFEHLARVTAFGIFSVLAISIGGFHDDVVGALDDLRISQNWHFGSPNVPTENQPSRFGGRVSFGIQIDFYRGSAQHMSSKVELAAHTLKDCKRMAVFNRAKLP